MSRPDSFVEFAGYDENGVWIVGWQDKYGNIIHAEDPTVLKWLAKTPTRELKRRVAEFCDEGGQP